MAMYFLSVAPDVCHPAGRSSRIDLRALHFTARRLTMWPSERRIQVNTAMHLARYLSFESAVSQML